MLLSNCFYLNSLQGAHHILNCIHTQPKNAGHLQAVDTEGLKTKCFKTSSCIMNKFHLCDIGSVRPQLRCEVSPVIHPAENILPYLNIMMMMMDHLVHDKNLGTIGLPLMLT